jgi:hypothetical protein
MNLRKLGMHGTSVGGVTIYPMDRWLASQSRPDGSTAGKTGHQRLAR